MPTSLKRDYLSQHVGVYLDVGALDLDVDPVVCAEGDGEKRRGDDGRDGGERQGNR